MSRVQILTIGVDKVTMDEAVRQCLAWIDGNEPRLVVTPNAEIAYQASKDPAVTAVLNAADLSVADGIGVVLASRILGDSVPEKVGGADLTNNLLAALSARGRGRVYLLGTKPEILPVAAAHVAERFPGVQVVGTHHGFFGPDEESDVIAAVKAAQPDVLVCGMGAPRQELWLSRHLQELGAKVSLGVGGTIDMWAGVSPRAPEWAIKANIEWLYRIIKLGRVRRSLPPLVKFGLAVTARRMRGR
jgi:N-acetylglucosaminyldiphosphoundecaprenol N-acetyl-beta-D-mannosaminyltransferase